MYTLYDFIDKKALLEKLSKLDSEKEEMSVMMVAFREKLKAREEEVVKLQQNVNDSVQLQHNITQLETSLNGRCCLTVFRDVSWVIFLGFYGYQYTLLQRFTELLLGLFIGSHISQEVFPGQ